MESLINIIIGGIIIVCIVYYIIYAGKASMYFHPMREKLFAPENATDIYVGNTHGWLCKKDPSSPSKLVILCHGNAGNIKHRSHLIEKFHTIGCDLLLFDYGGYGMSKGTPSEQQFYDTAQSVFDYAINELGYPKQEIVLYGESIGCPVAMKTAQANGVEKVILQSGPHSVQEVVRGMFSTTIAWFLNWFVSNDFPTYRYLEDFQGKCLIIHGKDDTLIRSINAVKLRECNQTVTELQFVEGGHNNLVLDWDTIRDFIMGPPLPTQPQS